MKGKSAVTRRKIEKIIQLILIIITISLIIYIINYVCAIILIKKQTALLNKITIEKNEQTTINKYLIGIRDYIKKEETKPIEKNERMIKIETLQNENSDIKGWIEIPETSISYPVLQGIDNEFYVKHNYNKVKTKSGAIFIDMIYDWNAPSTNMLIYGHNMKNGTMFSGLLKYKSKKYYENHQTIRFTTNSSDTIYEIISVFESKVYDENEKVFKYYDFINANNEDEFNNFITNIKELAIYDTGKTAKYGDELMTLSTCAYHTKNGRFAIVAKKLK